MEDMPACPHACFQIGPANDCIYLTYSFWKIKENSFKFVNAENPVHDSRFNYFFCM